MDDEVGAAGGLIRLTFLVQGVYAEVGRDCDLTAAQAQMLCSVADRSVGMAELSAVLGLEKSSVTGLVDRAEQRGLVLREQDPSDRRAVRVSLTPAGRRALTKFRAEVTARLDEVLDALPATERERFTRTVRRIVADVPAVFAD